MQHKQELLSNSINLDRLGCAIVVPVRYSAKAKRIIIKIKHDSAELVLPNKNLRLIYKLGHKFLLEKEAWVRQKLQKQHSLDINAIPFLGKIYSLNYINANLNVVEVKNDTIQVYSTPSQHQQTLTNFLKDRLLVLIENYATLLREQHNLNFSKIKIINNKGKWGSCSSKAVISFNWRLAFVPEEIVQYLVAHEMCHLAEMNHSQRFWNLVAKLDPNYKLSRLWLKKHSAQLYGYLR